MPPSGGDVRVRTAYSETDDETENSGSRLHYISWGTQSVQVHETERSNAVVAQAAAHILLLRGHCRTQCGGRDDCRSAKHVHVTCTKDATMNESNVFSETSLELDVSRRGTGRTCLMFVFVCCTKRTRSVHTSLDVVTITHLCDSRLHQSGKRVSLHNIHVLTLTHLVLSWPVLHAQLFVVPGYTLRA